jgi:hypothetical protein
MVIINHTDDARIAKRDNSSGARDFNQDRPINFDDSTRGRHRPSYAINSDRQVFVGHRELADENPIKLINLSAIADFLGIVSSIATVNDAGLERYRNLIQVYDAVHSHNSLLPRSLNFGIRE